MSSFFNISSCGSSSAGPIISAATDSEVPSTLLPNTQVEPGSEFVGNPLPISPPETSNDNYLSNLALAASLKAQAGVTNDTDTVFGENDPIGIGNLGTDDLINPDKDDMVTAPDFEKIPTSIKSSNNNDVPLSVFEPGGTELVERSPLERDHSLISVPKSNPLW